MVSLRLVCPVLSIIVFFSSMFLITKLINVHMCNLHGINGSDPVGAFGGGRLCPGFHSHQAGC